MFPLSPEPAGDEQTLIHVPGLAGSGQIEELTETMSPTAGRDCRRQRAVQTVAAATIGLAGKLGSRRFALECDIL